MFLAQIVFGKYFVESFVVSQKYSIGNLSQTLFNQQLLLRNAIITKAGFAYAGI